MQDSRANSTLELVVNEQQMQGMSRTDLRSGASINSLNGQTGFRFEDLKQWPSRVRESFGNKVDEAKAKSDTKCGFFIEVIRVFSGTIIWSACFLFTIIMPIVLFILGLVNLDDCTDRPSLPYLIFSMGFVMTISNLFNLATSLNLPILHNQHLLSPDVKNIIASIVNILFNCIVTFLYVLCAYMVYTIYRNHPQQPDGVVDVVDCNPTLYGFTYWFITITLSLSAVIILLAIILFCYNKYRLAIIRGSTPRSQAEGGAPNPLSRV